MRYVHRGYVAVIDRPGPVSLLRPGPHFKPPWLRMTFYPTEPREVTIKTSSEGSRGSCNFDISLFLSVAADSVPSLHRAYGGRYVESCVTPLVADFLLRRGNAVEGWGPDSEKAGRELVAYLDTALNGLGVGVHSAWMRSYEVKTSLDSTIE